MALSVARLRRRDWFEDRRTPERRMQVTYHAGDQLVVFSIWHGNTCAGSFQLPIEESSRLIAQLADAEHVVRVADAT